MLAEGFVTEAEPVHGAGPKIFDENVGRRDQVPRNDLALRRLEVDTNAPLVAVVHCEVTGAGAAKLTSPVTVNRLNADNISSQIGKHQAGGRPHHHVRELDDLQPVERQLR